MYLGATTSMMWVKCLDIVMGNSLRSWHHSSSCPRPAWGQELRAVVAQRDAVQWCSGAVVQWCSGAVVQWCSGAVGSGQRSSGANSRQGCRSGHGLQPSGRTEVATAIKPALRVKFRSSTRDPPYDTLKSPSQKSDASSEHGELSNQDRKQQPSTGT